MSAFQWWKAVVLLTKLCVFRHKLEIVDESSGQGESRDDIGREMLQDSDPTPILQRAVHRQLVDLNVIDRSVHVIENDRHATAAV